MALEELRELFPQLREKVHGKPLVYLDNAATSLRPASVIEKWSELASRKNSNIHRSIHHFSNLATEEYESAREYVRAYINASSCKEVILTTGTTDSINLVAMSFGEKFVKKGDEILVGLSEHHSDIVPWQMLCQRKGAVLKAIGLDCEGRISTDSLKSLLSDRTAIVAVAHASNVLGLVNPLEEIISLAHSKGVPVLVDGAQGFVHCKPDMQALDCDFYAFSGHKTYSATGVGVLYGKGEWLEQMPPYMGGGDMIELVSFEGTSYAALPLKFEAGTRNFNAVPTLVPALELSEQMNSSEEVRAEQKLIESFLNQEFSNIEGLHLYGSSQKNRIPVYSITVEGAHHEDLAQILDKMGIAVRSGKFCSDPLMDHFGVTGMLRASFAPYNTLAEAEYFVSSLRKAINMLR